MIKNGEYYVSQLDNLNRQTTVINGAVKDAKKNKVSCNLISGGNHPYKAPGAKEVAFPEAVNHWEARRARVICYRAAVLEPFYNVYKELIKELPKLAPKEKEDKDFEKEFLALKDKTYVNLQGKAKAKTCPYSTTCKVLDKKEFAKNTIKKGVIKAIQEALKKRMSRPAKIRTGLRKLPTKPPGPTPRRN